MKSFENLCHLEAENSPEAAGVKLGDAKLVNKVAALYTHTV